MNGKEWYQQQLRTSEWKQKRREIFLRDGHQCTDCRKKGVCIHCHHLYYVEGKMPWNYPLYAFVTLCKSCHDNRHKYLITKHASHDDAETWIIFSDIEQQMIEEEIELSYERIDELTERDAVWEANGRYYCRTDEEGHARFFDEDGNEL